MFNIKTQLETQKVKREKFPSFLNIHRHFTSLKICCEAKSFSRILTSLTEVGENLFLRKFFAHLHATLSNPS